MSEAQPPSPSASPAPPDARPDQRPRLWARVARLGMRVREAFPLTLRGAGIVAAAAFGLERFGFRELDGVWYVAGFGLLALSALSGLCMLVGTAIVWRALRRAQPFQGPLATDTGLALPTGFALPALRFVPLVAVRAELAPRSAGELLLASDDGRLRESLRFSDHGEVRGLLRRVEVRDVLGISAIALRRPARVEIDVLPHLGAFRSLPLLYSLSGGDDMPHPLGVEQGDRLELKRYAPGDPARFIHWKVFARTGKLVVRMPERALSRAYRVAAFLCAGEGDGASAAAARAALVNGALGADYRFSADGAPGVARDVGEGLAQIRRSSAARDRSGDGLAPFLAQVDREGPCALVLFVPPTDLRAQARLRDVLRARPRPVRVVIGVDGVGLSGARGWASRVLFAHSAAHAVAAAELQASIAAYRKLGADVVVLDRISGRVLSEAHFTRPEARAEAAE